MYKIFGFIFMLVSSCSFSAPDVTCTPLTSGKHTKLITLPGVEDPHATKVYFINNVSKESLWVDHPVKNRTAQAGWSSYLRPGQWSALLLNQKNFDLSCAVIQPGNVINRDCSESLAVCVPSKFVFNSKRKGSYWLVEDQKWDDLLLSLAKRGVKFTKIK